jgi:hypothetical protein
MEYILRRIRHWCRAKLRGSVALVFHWRVPKELSNCVGHRAPREWNSFPAVRGIPRLAVSFTEAPRNKCISQQASCYVQDLKFSRLPKLIESSWAVSPVTLLKLQTFRSPYPSRMISETSATLNQLTTNSESLVRERNYTDRATAACRLS